MTRRHLVVLFAAALTVAALPAWADKDDKGKGASKAAERAEQELERGPADKGMKHDRAERRADGDHAKRDRADDRPNRADRVHPRDEQRDEPGSQARGEEMRERRDERRQIMEDARADQEAGEPQAGKKPWWRFWESD